MTDHEGNSKINLAGGIQEGLEKLTITLGFALGNSQLFPGPTESREQRWIFLLAEGSVIICLLYHYM